MRAHPDVRSCTRTGCRWPAAASLSYRYSSRQAWLLDLSPVSDPSLYDLCPHHADHLTVPRGWERVDQRTESQPMVELSHAERAAVHQPVAHASMPVGARREETSASRYAALAADLPRIAREVGASHGDVADRPAGEAERAGSRPRPSAAAVPSRDLAPLPIGDAADARQAEAAMPGPRPDPADTAARLPPDPGFLEGQLSMLGESEGGGGVVLPFGHPPARRRPPDDGA